MEVATKRKTESPKLVSRREFARVVLGAGACLSSHRADHDELRVHEALRLVLVEGLEKRWKRHEQNHLAFKAGLNELGLASARRKDINFGN